MMHFRKHASWIEYPLERWYGDDFVYACCSLLRALDSNFEYFYLEKIVSPSEVDYYYEEFHSLNNFSFEF